MSDETSSSSGRRQASRTLYPDLTSAYARIQGRRTVSTLSSQAGREETRFPLSPTSSSSEENEHDRFDALSVGNEVIPLQDLSCQRVQSAHGVLHEADHHQESSAILETSDDTETTSHTEDRLSATIDDIVSQYADDGADDSSALPILQPDGHQLMHDHEIHETQYGQDINTPHDSRSMFLSPHNERRSVGGLALEEQQDADRSVQSIANSQGDKEEWEALPESSRSGFLTPSWQRFRLTKRETGDTSDSSFNDKTPTTPWDPISSSARGNLPPDLAHRQTDLHAPKQLTRNKYSGPGREQQVQTEMQTTSGRSFLRSGQNRAAGSLGTLGELPHVQTLASPRPSRHLTPLTDSVLPSSSLFPRARISALSSSSLLPQDMGRIMTPHPPPRAAMKPLNEPTMPHGQGFSRSRDGQTAQSATPSNQRLTTQARIFIPRSGSGNAATDPGRTLDQQGLSAGFRKMASATESHNRLLTEQLREGRYQSNDAGISRFLRDTVQIGTNSLPSRVNRSESLPNSRGIKTTGSSLANYSSDSVPLNRPRNHGLGSSITSSLANATQHKNNSTHSTTASLLPADWTQSLDTLGLAACPTFPLTAQQLGSPGLPGIGWVPFARLQTLDNGEWLERAWCAVHQQMEFSHATLAKNRAEASSVDIQRRAGRFLLVACVATFWFGGFALAHDMGEGGALSSGAMAELTKWLSGREDGAVAHVHPVDARLARAVERVGLLVVVGLLLGCAGVLVWAATI
ncbi:hypothetical protein A1O1_00014 [Capronia coronata CBS 617.96]|uniref:Uncharacterized protein n=1 Tax=Capronia coronata CBS 617.96 TaxID=1182541 RepID=W9Z025_9EURO|nr:uncharacterized protein A1O1_00014 [Capronia coronata CBS 617.96]EXJ94896.1 hypothetical protein A1O1_00014 [Capronia coronata CBS 617.96]